MDFSSAVKSDVLRPVLNFVVPGTFAIAPYLVIAAHYLPFVPSFWNDHSAAFSALAIVLVLFVGGLLEDFGTRLEVFWDERLNALPNHNANWDKYLSLRIKDEIIGQRYIRNLLTRFKFELSMVFALPIMLVGLVWLNALYQVWSDTAFAGVAVIVLIVENYLLDESYQSAKLLHKTRQIVIDAVDRPAGIAEGQGSSYRGDEHHDASA